MSAIDAIGLALIVLSTCVIFVLFVEPKLQQFEEAAESWFTSDCACGNAANDQELTHHSPQGCMPQREVL